MTREDGHLTCPPAATSVAESRRFVRAQLVALGAGDDLIETAELLVSELVTNVVLHARTPATVSVRALGTGAYRVSVSDQNPDGVQRRSYSAQQSTGRGLRLVEVLARQWGVEPSPDPRVQGKEVWFVLPAQAASTESVAAAYQAMEDPGIEHASAS